ncbi:MAG TPA: universal stress protein [Rhodanobacteraceae bacterium]|jgi:nucleotide-binding universal stress UspA family protein
MQDILVYTDNFRQPWKPAIEYAGRLAVALGASLTGTYIYPSPLYTAPRYSSPDLIAAIFQNARRLESEAAAAHEPFIQWAQALGVGRPSWHVAEGDVADALAQIGTWHDLLILDVNEDETWGSPSDVAMLVLATHLPTIVVPSDVRAPKLDCIALAWNGAPEAVRAIHAALPLLQRAKRVVLLRGEQRNAFLDITWKPPFEVDTHLARHGVAFDEYNVGADDEHAGEALLEAAHKVDADLLVMGAYGRTRFSEWALGGATRHVLNHARLPVFMRH